MGTVCLNTAAENSAADTSAAENSAARHDAHGSAALPPARAAWVRPDFAAFDTAMEVTAYAARD
ncbi:coenzyme PQQ precursor peptide PqqA [Streptacidiphilus sp. MAP12-33]|uniref:pyrroloquinoline quinone precursor peptide PqqA n=1 Tax=Streptacidiphilus sp. MAP12-33 TaxID=3156266 RepID=UPI003513CE3E